MENVNDELAKNFLKVIRRYFRSGKDGGISRSILRKLEDQKRQITYVIYFGRSYATLETGHLHNMKLA